ncbi:MAG: DsbA family protein [Gemmatimonadota bacterium]|nr:DsbA family protein [Gemmatimonadota bacterium]
MRIARQGDDFTIGLSLRGLTVTAAVLAGIVAGLGVYVGVRALSDPDDDGGRPADPAGTWELAPRFAVDTSGRPATGPAAARVTIIEFTDYQCPFCRRHAVEVLPHLLARWGDSVRYVVRNFPNLVLHPRALPAAVAVECAHVQGRFWEYRSVLLRDSIDLSPTGLHQAATGAALDTAAFARCVATRATRPVVALDLLDAWEAGVFGTPTFFINGRRFPGERALADLNEFVARALSD